MATTIRIELNSSNIRAFLQSAEMDKVGLPVADKIMAAAGEGHEVEVLPGGDRRSYIIRAATEEAWVKELTHRNLTKALDAGRG